MSDLTKEQLEYICSRCDESSTGRVIVSARIINKYMEFTGDYSSDKEIIKMRIINLYYNALRNHTFKSIG